MSEQASQSMADKLKEMAAAASTKNPEVIPAEQEQLNKVADPSTQAAPVPAPVPSVQAPPVVEERKFQHYSSSRLNMAMLTKIGQRINFISGVFITDDKSVIRYLDEEIANGLNIITKGELLTEKEADPMEALKKKHIAEYLEQQAELAKQASLGITRDMGETEEKTRLNPLSSNLLPS